MRYGDNVIMDLIEKEVVEEEEVVIDKMGNGLLLIFLVGCVVTT